MAGPDPNTFSATGFREGIRAAMQMGMPQEPITFIMPPEIEEVGVDAQGVPWDPTLVGTAPESGEELTAHCAFETFDASGINTTGTDVAPIKVVVTILDEDWAPVAECVAIRLGGIVYGRDRNRPPLGMFSVGVIQVIFLAGDV